jgi:hypothetical protein
VASWKFPSIVQLPSLSIFVVTCVSVSLRHHQCHAPVCCTTITVELPHHTCAVHDETRFDRTCDTTHQNARVTIKLESAVGLYSTEINYCSVKENQICFRPESSHLCTDL